LLADDVKAVCWDVLVSYRMEFEEGSMGSALPTDVYADDVVFVLERTLAETVVVVVVVVESLADEVLRSMFSRTYLKHI
jgi:hypothetical protein